MTLASSRKSAGFDSMDVLFFIFGRISHHMIPSPSHRYRSLDLTTDHLMLPTDIWQNLWPQLPTWYHRIVHGETRQYYGPAA